MVTSPQFIIGLDLHGTILEPGETVRPENVEPLAASLAALKGKAARFLCTGNDLDFVLRKVPAPVLAEIDGHVLETGCSRSPDGKKEEVIVSDSELATIRALDLTLRERAFPEVNYFAHRLATISMFCDRPREFYETAAAFVNSTRFAPLVHVTYSSVAVDILPTGYDKQKGLAAAAHGQKTIGVADSMNDRALLEVADYSFAPKNLAPELRPLLQASGRQILPLAQAKSLQPNTLLVASQNETRGVIEILEFLNGAI